MPTRHIGEMKVFCGSSNKLLAGEICAKLGVNPGKLNVRRFADGEVDLQILENVRGADCYVIQPTSSPVNENLMELLIMFDALRRASAGRITGVLPYYGYGRADRKVRPRVPITAKLVANLIASAGGDRVMALDLHAGQIQGFFDIPVDNLEGAPVFVDYMRRNHRGKLAVVSPDVGGVERARIFASKLNAKSLVIVDKRRPRPNVAHVYNVIGDVRGKTCIIVDDIVDTAGTLAAVAVALKNHGAKGILAACTHAVLSNDAVEKIENSPIEALLTTNTITPKCCSSKIKCLSVAPILAEAIKRNHNGLSISEMFD
ncbi:MAG: ribose-phosphate pyrophosphokinase [Elusimicrobia bacterium]|nr:ribose-phosphate pyrophosphokinase [Elusimicrobiota bacterium]